MMVFLQAAIFSTKSSTRLKSMNGLGYVALAFVLIYMGFRPIADVFPDMYTYSKIFEEAKFGGIEAVKDLGFNLFVSTAANWIEADTFFLLCTMFYVILTYIALKKWFKSYWGYGFLMLAGSLTFWSFGVSAIRNGLATSFFLLALSRDRKLVQIFWLAVSLSFHQSMMLPIFAWVASQIYRNPIFYLRIWIMCIPLSLIFGSFWENYFSTLGFADNRIDYLTAALDENQISKQGFRWDFILYSTSGVLAGAYYIFRKKIEDSFYISLFNTFLLSNAMWILVIRASFSDRFAYVSWFLLGLIIIYPLLKFKIFKYQYLVIGYLLVTSCSFTYFINA